MRKMNEEKNENNVNEEIKREQNLEEIKENVIFYAKYTDIN